MKYTQTVFSTSGERFYNITQQVQSALDDLMKQSPSPSGVLTLFNPHTSCALTINEAHDISAANDMENFLKHLAPRELPFITHTMEGSDDSPSHMKSILLQTSLQLIVEEGNLVLGTWQGIYLCEFRDAPKQRSLYLKFIPDHSAL